jgi:hypothetical protein
MARRLRCVRRGRFCSGMERRAVNFKSAASEIIPNKVNSQTWTTLALFMEQRPTPGKVERAPDSVPEGEELPSSTTKVWPKALNNEDNDPGSPRV